MLACVLIKVAQICLISKIRDSIIKMKENNAAISQKSFSYNCLQTNVFQQNPSEVSRYQTSILAHVCIASSMPGHFGLLVHFL